MEKLENKIREYLPVFNRELALFCDDLFSKSNPQLLEIFRYHLGLNLTDSGQGKRIRPLLVLLCAEGSGSNWHNALPAAVAVELIHNFSLIHDDIEDNGTTRRGQEAVWVKWGLPIAISAGDVMFSAAFASLNQLFKTVGQKTALQASHLLAETCLHLTQGQHLDLTFQIENNVTIEDYYRMIEGKTAALFACCTKIGALISGLEEKSIEDFRLFGHYLGVSFQIYDDWLGIWGDSVQTGKSASSDLVEGKKSLPVLYGLEQSHRFHKRWDDGPIIESDAIEIAGWLREDGVESRVRNEFLRWHKCLQGQLEHLNCGPSLRSNLDELIEQLTIRTK